MENAKWDSTNAFFIKKSSLSIKWCNYYCKNSISKPYYNGEKDYAFVIYNTEGYVTIIYVFKKNEEDWLLVDEIENIVR